MPMTDPIAPLSPKVAQPVTRLVGLRVVVDPPRLSWGYQQTEAERVRDLERWAKEFEEFIHDHRSQDPISVSVEKDTRTFCDQCSNEAETYTEDGVTYCASCGLVWEPLR